MTIRTETDKSKGTTAKAVAFLLIVIIWVLIDQLTKSHFADMEPGGILAGPFLGLVDIRLVHNTGGAWGIFSDSTFGLGVFSLIVCLAIAVFFFKTIKESSGLQTFAFALIVDGGIGNAIDRFIQGYVIDFVEFSFFDFPVFNIADIGVTCGFALLVIGVILMLKSDERDGDS